MTKEEAIKIGNKLGVNVEAIESGPKQEAIEWYKEGLELKKKVNEIETKATAFNRRFRQIDFIRYRLAMLG